MAADLPIRVKVPRLISRQLSMRASLAAAVVAVLAVTAWAFVTLPTTDALIGSVGIALVAVVGLGLVSRGHQLDTSTGELVRTVFLGFSRSIPWSGAEVATLHNRGGVVLLQVRGPAGVATYLPLAAADLGGERSQEPGLLWLLAGEMERWGKHVEVAARLRAQADHVAAGRPLLESPLARQHLPHAR